jgi:hypothetical protein
MLLQLLISPEFIELPARKKSGVIARVISRHEPGILACFDLNVLGHAGAFAAFNPAHFPTPQFQDLVDQFVLARLGIPRSQIRSTTLTNVTIPTPLKVYLIAETIMGPCHDTDRLLDRLSATKARNAFDSPLPEFFHVLWRDMGQHVGMHIEPVFAMPFMDINVKMLAVPGLQPLLFFVIEPGQQLGRLIVIYDPDGSQGQRHMGIEWDAVSPVHKGDAVVNIDDVSP